MSEDEDELGGDWGVESDEQPVTSQPVVSAQPGQKSGAPRRPIGVLILFAWLVAGILFIGLWSTRGLPKNTAASKAQWEAEILAKQAPNLKSRYKEPKYTRAEDTREDVAGRESRQKAKAAAEEEASELVPQLHAFVNDFDFDKRDRLATRLVELHKVHRHPWHIEEALASAGAWEALLRLEKPQRDYWGDIAMRTESWDLIQAKDPNHYPYLKGANAFCLAGASSEAKGVFKWLFEGGHKGSLSDLRAGALSCGLTESDVGTSLLGFAPRMAEVGVIASRDMYKTMRSRAYRDMKGTAWGAMVRFSLAVALYQENQIAEKELIKSASSVGWVCSSVTPNLRWANEVPRPEFFLQAAERIPGSNTVVLDALHGAALHASLVHQVEPPVVPRGDVSDLCKAQVEYETDPKAALKRIQRMVKQDSENRRLLEMLALTAARAGDFESALDSSERLIALTKPQSRHVGAERWMQLAFAHKLGRLEALDLTGEPELLIRIRDALLGDDAQRAAVRLEILNTPMATPVFTAYIRGALAPGHEEVYADGYVVNSSLSTYMFSRAEAARWRGDESSEQKWTERRRRLHERVREGQKGGPSLLWMR